MLPEIERFLAHRIIRRGEVHPVRLHKQPMKPDHLQSVITHDLAVRFRVGDR